MSNVLLGDVPILGRVIKRLRRAGCASAELDARLLLERATGLAYADLLNRGGGDLSLSEEEERDFEDYVGRRVSGEPVSRICRRRHFWKSEFEIGEGVFDPRPESELLVELALLRVGGVSGAHILDLGTGSGCLLLSLLLEREGWRGIGIDREAACVRQAQRNARWLGLSARAHFFCVDWSWEFSGQFDLVLVNPPYIPRGEIGGLSREVRDYDPLAALDGGEDGLAAYRVLGPVLGGLLKSSGVVLLEVGLGQAERVLALFRQYGLVGDIFSDLGGMERVIVLAKD